MDERRHLSEHGVSKTVKQIKCNQKFKLKYSAEILLSTYTSKTWLKITCFHVYSANPVYGGERHEMMIPLKQP